MSDNTYHVTHSIEQGDVDRQLAAGGTMGKLSEKGAVMAKVTIDDLAGMIKKQFDHQDGRFGQIDKRFDQIDKRFDGVDKRLDVVEKDIKDLKAGQMRLEDSARAIRLELTDIKARLARVEKRTLEDDDVLVDEIETLKARVAVLESKLNKLKVVH